MENNKPICVIIRGIPGSGKTTFSRTMFPNTFRIENDMFHYHDSRYEFNTHRQKDAIQWCIDITSLTMNKGVDIVVSNTFTKKRYIDYYKNISESCGYKLIVYRMMGKFNNIHDVPKNIYESMKNNFEDYEGEIFVYPTSENEKYEFLTTKKEN